MELYGEQVPGTRLDVISKNPTGKSSWNIFRYSGFSKIRQVIRGPKSNLGSSHNPSSAWMTSP